MKDEYRKARTIDFHTQGNQPVPRKQNKDMLGDSHPVHREENQSNYHYWDS